MIDDYDKTMELMRKMEAQLPIPARPTSRLMRALQEQGAQIARHQELQIRNVYYSGDEGGVLCGMTLSEDAKEALVVSITHLRVDPRHALAREIRAYQRERTKKLARSRRPGKPPSFTVPPRKRRRR